jgi:hypothetical protein
MSENKKLYIQYKITPDNQVLFGFGENLNAISFDKYPPIYDSRGGDKVKKLIQEKKIEDHLIEFINEWFEKPQIRGMLWIPTGTIYEIYEFGKNTPVYRGIFKEFNYGR